MNVTRTDGKGQKQVAAEKAAVVRCALRGAPKEVLRAVDLIVRSGFAYEAHRALFYQTSRIYPVVKTAAKARR